MKKATTKKAAKAKGLTPNQRELLVRLQRGWMIIRCKTSTRRTARSTSFDYGLVLARSLEDSAVGAVVNTRTLDSLIAAGFVEEIKHEAPKFESLGDLLRWSGTPREKYRITKAGRTVAGAGVGL